MAKDTQKAVPLTEEQLIERESALKIAEQKLSDDQANFVLEQNKLEKDKSALETEKSTFETAKANLEAREKALKENAEVKSDEKSGPISFKFEGEQYQFTDDAPQLINYGGQPFSQKEISENEEVLIQFIGGNSSLIIKK